MDELRRQNADAGGVLEKIFLSLVDAEEKPSGKRVGRRGRRTTRVNAASHSVEAPALGPLEIWRGLTPPQRNAFVASYLGWTLDAFDFFILVMVVRHIAQDFHTAAESVTRAIVLTLAFRPLGALVFGLLADRYGRRPTLMFNVAFFSLMELLSGFAPTLGWLLVLRALYGFGMGGEWGVGASLVMESVPRAGEGAAVRDFAAGLSRGLSAGGGHVQMRVSTPGGWRWMFFVGFLPALLALLYPRVGR